jgi:hypothetical protein
MLSSLHHELTQRTGAVILSKKDGSVVTDIEARALLGNYGPLELIAPTEVPNQRLGSTAQGMFVRFAFYLDCRDALRVSAQHPPHSTIT